MAKEQLPVPITNCMNKCILSSTSFQDALKIADIIPVYKKQDLSYKIYYRPINLLPIISKIFVKALYSQLKTVTNKIFSPNLCGFKKWHSSKNALLNLLKNWQKCLDTSGELGTVLMDLN